MKSKFFRDFEVLSKEAFIERYRITENQYNDLLAVYNAL